MAVKSTVSVPPPSISTIPFWTTATPLPLTFEVLVKSTVPLVSARNVPPELVTVPVTDTMPPDSASTIAPLPIVSPPLSVRTAESTVAPPDTKPSTRNVEPEVMVAPSTVTDVGA